MKTGKKIVVIGGGHGTGIVLSSLAGSGHKLSAIVSMADDGGSTGKLREELNASAVGDIRQCLVRLADKPEAAELFSYRFEGGKLDGHSLGNLFLANGEVQTGSLSSSIATAKKMLGVSADIIPATEDKPYLYAEYGGNTTKGVYKIAGEDFDGRKAEFSLKPESSVSKEAESALKEAELVLIAPGNFYCSIIPALLVKGLEEAINGSKAKTVFIANLVNRRNQTVGYSTGDYIDEINRLTGGLDISVVLYNNASINPACLREGEQPVAVGSEGNGYTALGRDIADSEPAPVSQADKIADIRSLARHDKRKLAQAVHEIINGL